MPENLIEILKYAGGGGLLFLCFYMYHKSTSDQFNSIIQQTFELLKTMIEQNTAQLAYLQKIDTNVTHNLWCPVIRKKAGDKNVIDN